MLVCDYNRIYEYNMVEKLEVIEIFKALTDETRLRIINLLKKDELCVCEIESILGITQSNASRHLNKLRNAGIINYQKKSQWVYYRLDKNFLKNNRSLIDYILSKTAAMNNCIKDINCLKNYKKRNISCKELTTV